MYEGLGGYVVIWIGNSICCEVFWFWKMVMFSFFISFFEVRKVGDKRRIIICVIFNDCILEKFFVIGLLILKEGIFLSSSCFKIIVVFLLFLV